MGDDRAGSLDFAALPLPVPARAKLSDPDWYIWGASMVRTSDGRCHLLYSRWRRTLGHHAWVTHSEIAYATADDPLGPYLHEGVALPPRGADHWDGLCTHNPTVLEAEGRFHLYYMGNTGDGQATPSLNWVHRNNQRIGVAVADHPAGPWRRFDTPLIDVGPEGAPDALMTSNPAVCRRPDGGFLMIYKGVGLANPLPFGGPVTHCLALADSPAGPFVKQPGTLFDAPGDAFPAEDPFVWHHADHGCYYALVKDQHGAFTGAGTMTLALFWSRDGADWRPAERPLALRREVRWEDGTVQPMAHLERPQLWRDDAGRPAVLFLAGDVDREQSFNVHLPLTA